MDNKTYRDEGIIFKKKDTGEADQVIFTLTKGHGKVVCVAKGIRRIASRKGGNADLFTYSKLSFAKGKNMDLLIQAESLDSFGNLKSDINSISNLFYIAELIDKFTVEEDEHLHEFTLLLSVLKFLNQGLNTDLILRYFELHLLNIAGYGINTANCAVCARRIDENDEVVMSDRGLVHKQRCRIESANYVYRYRVDLSINDLKLIRFLLNSDLKDIFRLTNIESNIAKIKALTKQIIQDTISSKIVSYDFFNINKNG